MRNIALVTMLAVTAALSSGASEASTGEPSTDRRAPSVAAFQTLLSKDRIFDPPFVADGPAHRSDALRTGLHFGQAPRFKVLAGMDQSSAETVVKILGLIGEILKAKSGSDDNPGGADSPQGDDADASPEGDDAEISADSDETDVDAGETASNGFNDKAAGKLIDGLRSLIENVSNDGGDAASEMQ